MAGYRVVFFFFHLCIVLAVTSTKNVKFITVDTVCLPIRLIIVASAVTLSDLTLPYLKPSGSETSDGF